MLPMMGLDWTMIILFPAILLSIWAQMRVKSTFARYSQVSTRSGLTAREAARRILDSYGLSAVPVREIAGSLTDHYDPRDRSLSLSQSVYDSTSIAAIGVAAHEVGHAVQHASGYAPLQFRNAIVPLVNITSSAAAPLFFIGLISASNAMMNLGILLFLGVLAFHLVTLPVEFDASRRALKVLAGNGMLNSGEVAGARKVLSAAAMTYVSATLMAALQLVRLIVLRNQRNRD
ncbi:MAG: zinc metallopeptidase [Pyramidobacter sp.]|jgi:Zn-dependent membrane protease YugP